VTGSPKSGKETPAPWPTEIRLKKAEKILEVVFDDGHAYRIPAELLRVESPSAEVQGHSASQKTVVGGRRHVGIMEVEPVGNYAVRLVFDDLHDTGIFTWAYLRHLGENQDNLFRDYLNALRDKGLTRDPPTRT
jgi:DUF971 family protein